MRFYSTYWRLYQNGSARYYSTLGASEYFPPATGWVVNGGTAPEPTTMMSEISNTGTRFIITGTSLNHDVTGAYNYVGTFNGYPYYANELYHIFAYTLASVLRWCITLKTNNLNPTTGCYYIPISEKPSIYSSWTGYNGWTLTDLVCTELDGGGVEFSRSVTQGLGNHQKPHENLAPRVFVSMLYGDASYLGEYYKQEGLINGQPWYKLDGSERYIFYYITEWSDEYWTMSSTLSYDGPFQKYGGDATGTYWNWGGGEAYVTLTEQPLPETGRNYIGAGSDSGSADGVFAYAGINSFGVPYYYNSDKALYLYMYTDYGINWLIGTDMNGYDSSLYYASGGTTAYPLLSGYYATYGVDPGPTFTLVVPIEESVSNDMEFDHSNDNNTSKGSGNNSGFGQEITNYTEHTRDVTHNLTLVQQNKGVLGELTDNYSAFDDSAEAFVQKNVPNPVKSAGMHQVVSKYKINSNTIVHGNGFNQIVSAVNSRGAANTMILNGEAHRAYLKEPDNILNLEQELFKIEYADPTSGFGQSVVVELVRPGFNNMLIGQSVSPAQSIYGRFGLSNLRLRSRVRTVVFRVGAGTGGSDAYSEDGVNWNPRVGDSDDPVTGVCPENTCVADHISLSYNGYFGAMDMDLRNPYEDSQGLQLNIINDYTRGKELQHFKNSYPTFETLNYKFQHLTLTKREEFFTFYKLSAGDEITLTDYCGREWLGVILDPECRSETYGRGGQCDNGLFYNLAFKFEGVLI
ncbi:MAG TPA: hypothetical protein PLE74_01180 [Candidatus Cloacimonadota bacterium]|nr:hypothetical protein [Candidatus Cloacimonadota bacterium]